MPGGGGVYLNYGHDVQVVVEAAVASRVKSLFAVFTAGSFHGCGAGGGHHGAMQPWPLPGRHRDHFYGCRRFPRHERTWTTLPGHQRQPVSRETRNWEVL